MKVAKKINRDSEAIVFFLYRNKITQAKIAEDLEISGTVVSATIHGKINNEKVLRRLKSLGVSERLLGVRLPEKKNGKRLKPFASNSGAGARV